MIELERSVVMEGALARTLHDHLIRSDGQEDLCFALWRPSTGRRRASGILTRAILPQSGERRVHGNASFMPAYFERALDEAVAERAGLAFLHSHPGPGWQDMSDDDVAAEEAHAGPALGATNLPLLGLTTGSDGTWSARFWLRKGRRRYYRQWCRNVRTIDERLIVDFADRLAPPPPPSPTLERTIHAWGDAMQVRLARIRVGVVGLGSVGAIVAESLARTGFQDVVLVDFDRVEFRNLDRLLHATRDDARRRRLKVDVAADALLQHAAAETFDVHRLPYGVHEIPGYEAAVDCDVLISCVDRPLPRHLLNLISYAHTIPVIDGGIFVRRAASGRLIGADWRAHTVGPNRRCLACVGQYDLGLVQADRDGLLDDPKYIEALPDDHPLRVKENVFAFSSACASLLVLQLLQSVIAPSGCASPGRQMYHFVPGILDSEVNPVGCEPTCTTATVLKDGDDVRPLLGLRLPATKEGTASSPGYIGWVSRSRGWVARALSQLRRRKAARREVER